MTRTLRPPSGAAVLLALLIVALVATMSVAMFVRQDATIAAEVTRRQAAQSRWILRGALDWARLILREDARTGGVDHLGEPWSVALAPISLRTFLAVNEQADDDVLSAQLAGKIDDLQARFNVRNLASEGEVKPIETEGFTLLLDSIGIKDASRVAQRTAEQVVQIVRGQAVAPQQIERLLGVDSADLVRLSKVLVWLPQRTLVNANTASAEVLAASVPRLGLSLARNLVERRASNHFRDLADFTARIPGLKDIDATRIAVNSNYFEVSGSVIWPDMRVEQRAVVRRSGAQVETVRIVVGPTMPN